jgi:hypothetical protein
MKFQFEKPKPRDGAAAKEKRRLVFLAGAFVVVVGILFSTLREARKGGAAPARRPVVDEGAPAQSLLAVPELDVARVESLVADREAADRVVLESEAADVVLATARRYTPRHYSELAAPELTRERNAALGADPAAARGKPFTARGRIVGLRPRAGAAHEEQFLGCLELEDGSSAHFLVLDVPEDAAEIGGFVRVDGLFLKVFSTEDELDPAQWNEGPLLVGSAAVPSYPGLGTVTTLDQDLFSRLEDANLAPDPGQAPRLVPETPPEPFWQLMAFARDLPEGAIDWAAAPELDQRLLDQLLEKPAEFRAMPVRIPISRLQDGRVKLAGENPARLERYTLGWIGNVTWRSVIQFRTPVLRPELVIGDLVYGNGFFLHDFSYESSERGLRVAPVFVLHSFARHVPEESKVLTRIPWVMAGIGLFLGVLFVFLTRRDKQRSAEFQAEIVRRRRKRRARGGESVGTATS